MNTFQNDDELGITKLELWRQRHGIPHPDKKRVKKSNRLRAERNRKPMFDRDLELVEKVKSAGEDAIPILHNPTYDKKDLPPYYYSPPPPTNEDEFEDKSSKIDVPCECVTYPCDCSKEQKKTNHNSGGGDSKHNGEKKTDGEKSSEENTVFGVDRNLILIGGGIAAALYLLANAEVK